jgi:hypothetical protein
MEATMSLWSRFVAATVICGVVFSACTSAATPAPTSAPATATATATPVDTTAVTVGWNSPPDIGYLPLLMAIDSMNAKGYKVATVTLAGDLTSQGLIQNSVQIANIGGLPVGAAAIAKGAPIKVIATRVANEAVWVSLTEYSNCATLTGKPVGLFAEVSSFTSQMNAYFDLNCKGVKPNYLTIPDSALRAQSMAAGGIVATVLGLADAVALDTKSPGKYKLVPMGTALGGVSDGILWSNDATLASHPSIITALITEQLLAIRSFYKDPSQVTAMAAKFNVSSPIANQYVEKKLWYANGGLGSTGIEQTLALFNLPGTRQTIVNAGPMNEALKAIGKSDATQY